MMVLVEILVGGIDNHKPRLFETDPTGIYFEYRATAIGEGEVEVEEILRKEYKEGITIEEALKLSLKALKKVLGDNFKIERIDTAYINIDKKRFTKFSKEKLDKIAADFKDKKKK